MTDTTGITQEINVIVGGNFEAWCIGLTNDPMRRKKQLKEDLNQDVSRWEQWQLDSLSDARLIERKYLDGGMKGAPDGGEPEIIAEVFPTYVYVF